MYAWKPQTLRPMLEFLNMTCGGKTVKGLWGETDSVLRRIIIAVNVEMPR